MCFTVEVVYSEELQTILTDFLSDKKQTVYAFPPSLTSRDRFLVHEVSVVVDV